MTSPLAFFRQQMLPSVICFGLAFLVSKSDFLERIDNLTLDQRTKLRAWLKPQPAHEDVILLAIDEPSVKAFGAWPWNREVHGDLLTLMGLVKPGVIAWDILFIDPAQDPKQDEHLAKGVIGGDVPVVFGIMRGEEGEGVTPDNERAKQSMLRPFTKVVGSRAKLEGSPSMMLATGSLSQLAAMAFVDTPRSSDGVVRKAPLVIRIADQVYPTLALRALMEYWRAKPEDIEVRVGEAIVVNAPLAKRRIPIDETGAYTINYRYALGGANAYSYSGTLSRLLAMYKKQPVKVPPLTAKVVFVGQVADGLIDMGPTPFSELTPLVLVHVNIADNILNEDYVRFVPPWTIWLGGVLFGAVGLARFSSRKLHEQIVFALGIPVAYAFTGSFLWLDQSRYLPMVGPMLGFFSLQAFMIGRRVIQEQKAKEQIKGMFGTYISPTLVNRMVESGQAPKLGGHEEEITAYFSDIQGYSTFSEKLTPAKLVELLNEYLTACTDIVQEEGGTLDKYIGDAVVAMYGAPIALPDHAYRACVSALRVQAKLDELRQKWDAAGDQWPEGVRKMRARIGLNTGSAIIGNMGSRTRFNYTMTGDNVNLAARMESGAKSWGAYIMCTEATKKACEEHGGDRVVFRPLGRIVVQGRTLPVPVYEATGFKEVVSATTRDCVRIFSEGLELYYQRDWDGALAKFRQSAELEPKKPDIDPGVKSNPSLVYLELVAECQQDPPPENWGGVFVMKSK